MKLMRSIVIFMILYACESWTWNAELEKRTQASEMRCYRRLLNILYMGHVSNEEFRRKIQAAIGKYDKLLTLVKKQKQNGLATSQGRVWLIIDNPTGQCEKKKIRRGGQKKRWEDYMYTCMSKSGQE